MAQQERCPGCGAWRWPFTRCPECHEPKRFELPQYPANDQWTHGPDAYRRQP